MLASIGNAILRFFSKQLFALLFNSILNFLQNLIRSEKNKKKADENSKEYAKPQTPEERDQNAEDLLNRN